MFRLCCVLQYKRIIRYAKVETKYRLYSQISIFDGEDGEKHGSKKSRGGEKGREVEKVGRKGQKKLGIRNEDWGGGRR